MSVDSKKTFWISSDLGKFPPHLDSVSSVLMLWFQWMFPPLDTGTIREPILAEDISIKGYLSPDR